MKYFFAFILFFTGYVFIPQKIVGQTCIKGTVLDTVSHKGVAWASASISQNNKVLQQMHTDSLGRFRLCGSFSRVVNLKISMVGYRPLENRIEIPVGADTIDVGILYLLQDTVSLKTIVVRGQKPLVEQRMDGIIFNADNLPVAAGSNASDVLRNVPLVQVDANGTVAVRGSSNVKVFIDGKPSEIYGSSIADALKAIPAENIARIEVITHPSARYDAESTDAVINIITKKQLSNATGGRLGLAIGNRSANISGNIQSRYNQWSVQADAFYQEYWNRNGTTLNRRSDQYEFLQENESRQKGGYFFGGINVSYSLDSLHTITAGYRSRFSTLVTNNTITNFEGTEYSPLLSFTRELETPFAFRGNTMSLSYTGISTDRNKELSLTAMYFGGNGSDKYNLQQLDEKDNKPYRERFASISQNRDFIVEANYTHKFNKGWKAETGAKIYGKNLSTDNAFDVYDYTTGMYRADEWRSNLFRYRSNVYAAYANLSLQLNKWGLSAGLRYEHTALEALFKDTMISIKPFNNVVPQFLINRALGDKKSLKFGYTMKLVRPYVSYLNPTAINSDSLNIQTGNPYLQPEITNRYQVSYTANYTKLFSDLCIFFNNNRNSIEQVREPQANGVFKSTWKNIGKNQRLGASASFNWKPVPSLSVGATVTAQYIWLHSKAMNISNKGLEQQLVLRTTYTLPKGYSIYLYGFFDGRKLSLQGYRTGWKYYSLTLSKKWKEDRFELNLRMDAFLTRYTWIKEQITTGSFEQTLRSRYQNQNFRLTFSWKIGKKEVKPIQARQAEREE